MQKIYLDNAATTRPLPEVAEAMQHALEEYGNPSGAYAQSRTARHIVDNAREQTARLINAAPEEIYFTAGGTEADNWAIKGAATRRMEKGRHIITSAIEHSAVLETCAFLQKLGWKVDYLPVDSKGRVNPADVERALTDETALVSIMLANNEIGTLQPVAEIAAICRQAGVLCHTDAVQAVGSIPVDVQSLGVDMLSLSAHKFYGPKGAGALYIRKGTDIDALLHGGHQESSRRAGTENVCGIAGLGKAAEIAMRDMQENAQRISHLRDRLLVGLLVMPKTYLFGHTTDRLPGNAHVCFEGIEGEMLLLKLDMAGIAASAGSACSSGSLQPSHVLDALGVPPEISAGALRLTLGRHTTDADIEYTLQTLRGIVEKLRGYSPAFKHIPGEKKLV